MDGQTPSRFTISEEVKGESWERGVGPDTRGEGKRVNLPLIVSPVLLGDPEVW